MTTRCPYHARAYGCQCQLEAGHDGLCVNGGDGFGGGWNPDEGPPGGEADKRARREIETRRKK